MIEIHQRLILVLLLLLFLKIEFVSGDWSDDSHLWSENPDLRRELLNEKRNKRDGVFWMPFTSFVKYFECVDICKLRHNWYEVRDSANFYPASKMMQGISLCNIKNN